jgi:iron complex outermembrane receptor protein
MFCSVAATLALSLTAFAQSDLKGRITDTETGDPLPGAVVLVQGTYLGTSAGPDGNFILHNLKAGSCCLVVKYISYVTDTVCVSIPYGENLAIGLRSDASARQEVIIQSTRAGDNSPMTYTSVSKEELAKNNFGQDLPYLLNQQPSVVTTSDAGAGVGYTGLRIRGSDASRVNVTINGVPVNDAESQGTYWVDLPDIVSSAENIQIQRGVGSSTNGAGAFGGTVSLQTDNTSRNPYAMISTSGGSFNTWRVTTKAGTGIMNNHWSFETRLSKLGSDGYIDRGSSDLSSWYMSGAYLGKKLTIKAITFAGREKTYQCWYGVPQDSLKTNRTYNPAGEYYDSNGHLTYYDNETDNYRQDYYQLHFVLKANPNWNINWSLHATKGIGYYEEYRWGDDLHNYGFTDSLLGPTDLVRRKWLDNWFYGIVYGFNYDSHKKLTMTIGGGANNYEGKHYDEIIWSLTQPRGITPVYRYNNDFAHKADVNVFVRMNYQPTESASLYADLQVRNLMYGFNGPDTTGTVLPQSVSLLFVNPKAGISFRTTERSMAYFSIAVGNKEPNRDDYVNSSASSRPKPETLYDAEAGWKFGSEKVFANANLYYMYYKNQLVLTGKVNDVGAYTRENVDASFRRGAELMFGAKLMEQFTVSANLALSQNKIIGYHEFIDDYDNGVQVDSAHGTTDIAFSPAIVSGLELAWESPKGFRAAIQEKFVGKQFLDNTSNDQRSIDAYATTGLTLSWTAIKRVEGANIRTKPFLMDELTFGVQLNNLLNTMYVSNGYTYGYIYGGQYNLYNYYYPQAGINMMGIITMKF